MSRSSMIFPPCHIVLLPVWQLEYLSLLTYIGKFLLFCFIWLLECPGTWVDGDIATIKSLGLEV
jgi:hypothetical protein